MEHNNVLPWHIVEKQINQEINWLDSIIIDSDTVHNKGFHCKKCILRRIAILIISGKVKVKEIKSSGFLWGKNKFVKSEKAHGSQWHHSMMDKIESYFRLKNYTITIEPYLTQGRADLGIYKENERDLFVEVGSISLNKFLINLESMEGCDFLLVLSDKHVIEFSILKKGYLN